ncbi:hypothetical protein SS50377_21167 [Spironucleus salmonicida]|uniref:Transmembrane protein n=1 Tax=Spironucleus salmonicida TaxID=348837 RepID=A0A9P8M2X3_9EUKA|nr:hypothetical protein SS50377_21167 [Spironucleus salmonicida]
MKDTNNDDQTQKYSYYMHHNEQQMQVKQFSMFNNTTIKTRCNLNIGIIFKAYILCFLLQVYVIYLDLQKKYKLLKIQIILLQLLILKIKRELYYKPMSDIRNTKLLLVQKTKLLI